MIPKREETQLVDDGSIVWNTWPEFRAFATRLGIDLDQLDSRGVTIRIMEGEMLLITHEYYGREPKPPIPAVIDTTTIQNDQYHIVVPKEVIHFGNHSTLCGLPENISLRRIEDRKRVTCPDCQRLLLQYKVGEFIPSI